MDQRAGLSGDRAVVADRSTLWVDQAHGRCSTHSPYRLTCAQFDALLERAAGRCEICRVPGEESSWGRLRIDHDGSVGQWAVRGLLCDGCNSRLRYDRRLPRTTAIERYLSDPWYQSECRRQGVSWELPPEPPVGSRARVGPYAMTRLPAKNGVPGWHGYIRNSPAVKSWTDLWHSYGPLLLRVTFTGDGSLDLSLEVGIQNLSAHELGQRIKSAVQIARSGSSCAGDGAILDRIVSALTRYEGE